MKLATDSPALRAAPWLCLMLMSAGPAAAQSTNSTLAISRGATNLTVSWTGRGGLQSAVDATGPWQSVLGAPNPFTVARTNEQQFFRAIDRWSTRSNLAEANSEMAVAELDGRIYVIGGYPASRVTVRTVQVYDPVSNRWQLTTPLPIPLNHLMAATTLGKLYVIGGQTNSSGTSAYVNTVFEYSPVSTNWIPRASMPTARSAGASAVIGDLIYVAGGRPPRGQDFAVYDARNNAWTTLPNLPTGRNHLAAAAIDGKVYVAGGRFDGGFTSEMTAVLEVYDPAAGSWSTRAPMPAPRGGVNGIAANGTFYVFGGEWANGVFADHEVYVPAQNRWHRLQPIPVPVHGVTGSAFLNGWIHLPGGGTAQGGSSGSTLHQVYFVGPGGP